MSQWLQVAAGSSRFGASVLLAAPAFLSIDSRQTLITASRLKLDIEDPTLLANQERQLLQHAAMQLRQERLFLRYGLSLLAASFALAVASVFA